METPDGYSAPIHLALTRVFTLGGVPRQLLIGWVLFCFGVGLLCKSWGAVVVYMLGHATMAYLTWREPYWPQILVEAVRHGLKLRRRRVWIVREPERRGRFPGRD